MSVGFFYMVKTEIDSFLQELCACDLLFCFTFLLYNTKSRPSLVYNLGKPSMFTSEEQLYFLFMAIKMTTLEIIIGLLLKPIFVF